MSYRDDEDLIGLTASAAPSDGELAAVEQLVFGKRRLLVIGVLSVVTPLVVLLILQLRWLLDLEHTSAIARRAALENYLTAITNESRIFFITLADRVLTLPAAAVDERSIQGAVRFFESRSTVGADRTFVMTLQPIPRLYFFDPESRSMVEEQKTSRDSRAVWVAAAPWITLHKTLGEVTVDGFTADEHDPGRRVILNPITDENNFLMAITGLIVDQEHFLGTVLPAAIRQALPLFDDPQALWVCVHDGDGNRVFPDAPCGSVEVDRVNRGFDFLFTDWRMSLQGDLAVPERWARTNFAVNVTLSTALVVVLVGGIIFTVRTAMRELKLSAMKNEFVSNVSHELRTPLASIRVFGELMRHGKVRDPSKVAEYGRHIETESRRLSQLIANILDFSRIESGRKTYSYATADLSALLRRTIDAYRVRLKDRGFNLEYEAPADPVPELVLDANAIDRAVANLLDNAIKYSDDGSRIVVRLKPGDREVTVTVKDEGIGIPAEEHDRIFERFHRVSTGLRHDVKGTGLGLSIVQHIVAAHGGYVSLESAVGEGSAFTIHLPVGWEPKNTERGHHGNGPHR